ncbi:hypothetical protein N7466_002652 [Penicillium verhagenii]|uniref:uncharacterized protein n=1 Tax=Penicillium verhagenii TaxID=1562060 RepID=UPI0025452A4B|nr:uncharacterized protein N7466_002652 [Penicillium verhagenii]KAJ5939518.1 hypothetical protein N7466_002652 [Penicillium verhagenii]
MKSYDEYAWAITTQIGDDWPRLLWTDEDIYNDMKTILSDKFSHLKCASFEHLRTGGFNVCFKMVFTNQFGAIIRLPLPGSIMFPEEKVRNEVSIMRFLMEKSSDKIPIPVPSVFRCEETKRSPPGLGPFIIMDYIRHVGSLEDLLEMPGRQKGERPVLNPDLILNSSRLEALFGKVAYILLSLSTLCLSRIGSVHKNEDSTWVVLHRPLSYSMNEIVQLGTLPQSSLPTITYDTTSSYIKDLAELHILHLKSQRNEATIDLDSIDLDADLNMLADEYRRKFVARFLFRKLAEDEEQRRKWICNDNGPFPVWCDDLRPENVLVEEAENIVGMVDWEFSYSAPVEFSNAPPCWLVLQKPEDWPEGLDDWCKKYEKALQIFLRAMQKSEDEAIRNKQLVESQRLSSRMRLSWESGSFWIMYAARNNFAFDKIYWEKIDQRFYGSTTHQTDNICDNWRMRLHLLEPGEWEVIEGYVRSKLEEKQEEKQEQKLTWNAGQYTEQWITQMRKKKLEREKGN